MSPQALIIMGVGLSFLLGDKLDGSTTTADGGASCGRGVTLLSCRSDDCGRPVFRPILPCGTFKQRCCQRENGSE
jgi:hypothetical protein